MTDFYRSTPEQQAKHLGTLARTALLQWDIDPSAQIDLIKHRENAVFAVTDGETRYALRVHRAGYHSDAELNSELQWIAAINSDELRTPQIIPASDGSAFVHVSVDSVPETRQVDLLEWFEGSPLASVEDGIEGGEDLVEVYRSVGSLMAITHNHSSAWTYPAGFERHAWDEDGLLGERPFWGEYWQLPALNSAQRERLEGVKIKALAELAAFGKSADRYGLIHADFVPENLLRCDQGICLIDFDDAGFGWHLFDIATSLFFHMGEPHFEAVTDALIAGYCEQRALPEDHLAHLPLFFLLRGMTYLGWAHTRAETATAREMTPMIVAAVDEMAKEYV